VATGGVGSLELVKSEFREVGEEVRSAMEWAQVRALAADGISEREIARRLGNNRPTVKRLVEADGPPRLERAPAGSMRDPLEAVIRQLMKDCPDIKAPRVTETLRDDYDYAGSVDLVRRRMAALRPPGGERAAQRTAYRPGQVMQVDWAETSTRPRIWGRERRVYALICSLPLSGASTAHFSLDMAIESFLEGHVRAFDWLGGVPRELRLRQPAFGGRQARR
jgi:transposase